MKRVVVLIWRTGGRYTFKDVSLIVTNIRKHNPDIEVLCFTNMLEQGEAMTLDGCRMIAMPYPEHMGWWSKMNLFSPELEKYRPFLFLDLDTIVQGSLQPLFPHSTELFYGIEDFYQPRQFASGMMWIPASSPIVALIWKDWLTNPEKIKKQHRGDQDFLKQYPNSFLDREYYTTFKPNCIWRSYRPEKEPVVCFHGIPSIWEAGKHIEWVYNYIKGIEPKKEAKRIRL